MKKLTYQQMKIMRTITIVGALISGIVMSISAYAGHWAMWPAMLVLIGLVIADIMLCRCPRCGRYLRTLTQERCFCPFCGQELD